MNNPLEALAMLVDTRPRLAAVETFAEYMANVIAIYPPEIVDVRKGFTCAACGEKTAEQVIYDLPYYTGAHFQFECPCGHVQPFRKGNDIVPAQPRDIDLYEDVVEAPAPSDLFTHAEETVQVAPFVSVDEQTPDGYRILASNGDGCELRQRGGAYFVYSGWNDRNQKISGIHFDAASAERTAWEKNVNGWHQAYLKRADIVWHDSQKVTAKR